MEIEPRKLFVGGISWDTSEERLRGYFETFGEVAEAVIMKDRATGRSRGFGFVVFANASVAEKVVRERHVIDGRTVEAKKAVPRDDNQNFNRINGSNIPYPTPTPTRTKKIFVGGLASSVTETDFKGYFGQFGTITDVVVMYDHNTQRPRGFGFITYDSEEAVDKVLFITFHELNGKMVEVKRAIPKELSPGPARSPLSGYNYGNMNRVSSFLNAYGMRMDGRFSPVSVGRSGYPPYSPSTYSTGPGFDSGFNGDSGLGLGYGHGLSSYYGRNSNGNNNPVGYGSINGESGSFLNTLNQDLRGNGSLNYGTNTAPFVGSRGGNGGTDGRIGSIGEIWGSSPIFRGAGNGSLGRGGLGYIGREGYGRSSVGTTPLYSASNSVRDGNFGNFNGFDSFYGDPVWRSPSPEFEGSAGTFGSGRANGSADVASENSVGYVGGYSVNARSNRGIAA